MTDGLHPGAKHKTEEAAEAAEAAREDGRAMEQKEQGPEPVPERQEKDTSASPDSAKKSFVCKACDKSFHFYCRLKVHVKRCRVAKSKQVQGKGDSDTRDSEKELGRQQPEARSAGAEPDAPKKKKKRLPVTCDLCGREFAHASGTSGGSRAAEAVAWPWPGCVCAMSAFITRTASQRDAVVS